MYLHKLASMSESQVLELINAKGISGETLKERVLQSQYEILIIQFLKNSLNFDDDGIAWFEGLIQVSSKLTSGFKFILNAYDIPSSKIKLFDAICSNDPDKMAPFFSEIRHTISTGLSTRIAKVFRGDVESLVSIVRHEIEPQHNKQNAEKFK